LIVARLRGIETCFSGSPHEPLENNVALDCVQFVAPLKEVSLHF